MLEWGPDGRKWGPPVKLSKVAAAVAAVDQLTKLWVTGRLAPGERLPLWPPWLDLTHVRNTGAAFGMFRSHNWWLAAVAAGVLLAAWLYRRQLARQPRPVQWAVGLGLGGAVGNLIDRVFRGAVIDFIDFKVWPVFNIADMAIVAGAAILLFYTVRDARPAGGAAGPGNGNAKDGIPTGKET